MNYLSCVSQIINLGLTPRPSVFMGSEHMSTLTILTASCFVCFHGLIRRYKHWNRDMTSQKSHYFAFYASILATFSISIQESWTSVKHNLCQLFSQMNARCLSAQTERDVWCDPTFLKMFYTTPLTLCSESFWISGSCFSFWLGVNEIHCITCWVTVLCWTNRCLVLTWQSSCFGSVCCNELVIWASSSHQAACSVRQIKLWWNPSV